MRDNRENAIGRKRAIASAVGVAGICVAVAAASSALHAPSTANVRQADLPVANNTPVTPVFDSPVDPLPSYRGQEENTCDMTAKPGPVALRAMLDETYGKRWSNIVRKCSGTGSSGHHAGRALDWNVNTDSPAQIAQTEALMDWLMAPDASGEKYAMARRMGLFYVIWDDKVFKLYRPSSGWADYSSCASDPAKQDPKYDTTCHRDHVHFSFTWQGARAETSFFEATSTAPEPKTDPSPEPKPEPSPEPKPEPSTPATPAACSRTASGTAPALPTTGLGFTSITPHRVLDTRDGTGFGGTPCVASSGKAFDLPVTGMAGVPKTGVQAVVLNVTATNAANDTWVSAYAAGGQRPATSGLHVDKAGTAASLMVVPVGADGSVTLLSGVATSDLIVDITGYFAAGSGDGFEPTSPTRLFDGTVKAGQWQTVPVNMSAGATSMVANVVGDNPGAPSFMTLHPTGGGKPSSSTVNPMPGRAVANRSMVGLGGSAAQLYSNVSQRAVVDSTGWFGPAGSTKFVPVAATRLVDSRNGQGLSGRLTARTAKPVKVAGKAGVPASAEAAVVTLTVVGASEPTWLSAWPAGAQWPGTSDVNAVNGSVQTNLAVVPLAEDGSMSVMTGLGSTDVVVDVLGYFRPIS